MPICSCATTNVHLKAWLDSNGEAGPCDACGVSGRPTVAATRLAEHIDGVVRRHYQPDTDDPDGEDPTALIRRVAGVDEDVAVRVQSVVHHDEHPNGPTFYHYGPLRFHERLFGEYSRRWSLLKKIATKEVRFLSDQVRSILDQLLGDMTTFCGGAAIRHLGVGERIFRARETHSLGEARKWFDAVDDSALRAPNDQPASRMNASGIRVFYGALQDGIAIAEIRPSIGSHIVLSAFTPTRRLTVLDLGALVDVHCYVDLFDPGFDVVSERLTFLRTMLEQEISRPIHPAEDSLGYVPTQIMSEYIHTVLGLDGLAYRSTQKGAAPSWGQVSGPRLEPNERNIALFGTAAMSTMEETADERAPGLRFLPESRQVLDVTRIEIHSAQNPGVHYTPPPQEN